MESARVAKEGRQGQGVGMSVGGVTNGHGGAR